MAVPPGNGEPGEPGVAVHLAEGAEPLVCRLTSGAVQIRLVAAQVEVVVSAFARAEVALRLQRGAGADGPHRLQHGVDASTASGFHELGGLSRFNAHREGFVFSDGALLDLTGEGEVPGGFLDTMRRFRRCAAEVAAEVLSAVERHCGAPAGWFRHQFGDLEGAAQWHIKRYRHGDDDDCRGGDMVQPPVAADAAATCAAAAGTTGVRQTLDGRDVLLPAHTDPSLISVVFINAAGGAKVEPGTRGLECAGLGPPGSCYAELPFSGPGIATVLVGAALDRISGGALPALRHRVVRAPEAGATTRGRPQAPRMAATFFFRPVPDAVLRTIPGRWASAGKPPLRWRDWLARTSRRYQAAKRSARQAPAPAVHGGGARRGEPGLDSCTS